MNEPKNVGAQDIVSQLKPTSAANVPLVLLVSIDQRWGKYISEWKSYCKAPTDEGVHSLRVATRRLRTLLKLLECVEPSKSLNKAVREYDSQMNRLDGLRDTHVMLDQIRGIVLQFPVLEPLQADLERKERREMRRTRREFKRLQPGRTAKMLVRWLERLEGQEDQDIPAALMGSIDDSFKTVQERYQRVDPDAPGTIHRVRLAFKKFRYKVEVLQPLLPGYPSEALECLDTYQDWMGAVQDIQVLRRVLDKFAAQNPELDLGPVNRNFDQRLKEAVSDYMKHKEKFRDFWRPDPGQSFPWRQTNENISATTWHCDGA